MTMTQAEASLRSIEVSAVIVRACPCGNPRTIGIPCESCGNPEPAMTHDLGIISADYKSWREKLRWLAYGRYFAVARTRKAGKGVV
jgi:hypothetical protein